MSSTQEQQQWKLRAPLGSARHHQSSAQRQPTPPRTHLSGVEVDEAVASRLPLQGSRLVEEEVKLLHVAELLQQLHQVVPAGEREQVRVSSVLSTVQQQLRGSRTF